MAKLMIVQRARKQFTSGLLLLDVVVYISLLAFLLILTATVFNRFLNQTGALRRNINDIERALKAGERWRADVRSANGPPRISGEGMRIPRVDGDLIYGLGTNVTRQMAGSKRVETVLTGVKTNQILLDQREHAAVWRWEVELQQRRKNARVRPLFTFMAVAGSN